MKYDARLEKWMITDQDSRGFKIVGDVYDDIKERFIDGSIIKTSLVVYRNVDEGDIVETRNSKYLLGRKDKI